MSVPATPHPCGPGLDQLDQVELDAGHRQMLEAAHAKSAGSDPWRMRKYREARNALALAQIAPRNRLRVLGLEMTSHLALQLHMRVTVPRMHDHRLHVVTEAILVVRYPQRVMLEDLPGVAFVQIQQPRAVWSANVDCMTGILCLGLSMPRNTPLVELIWLSYTALSGQTWMVDERDAAGVLNPDAASWWSHNLDKLPLTTTALLEDRPLAMNPAVAAHQDDANGGGA